MVSVARTEFVHVRDYHTITIAVGEGLYASLPGVVTVRTWHRPLSGQSMSSDIYTWLGLQLGRTKMSVGRVTHSPEA